MGSRTVFYNIVDFKKRFHIYSSVLDEKGDSKQEVPTIKKNCLDTTTETTTSSIPGISTEYVKCKLSFTRGRFILQRTVRFVTTTVRRMMIYHCVWFMVIAMAWYRLILWGHIILRYQQ